MFTIKIADLTVAITHRYPYVEHLCRHYVVENVPQADMEISVSEEAIHEQMACSEIPTTPAYAEGICVYREICRRLPGAFDAFLMHGAVIEYEGKGYIFAARSGTGKSTHISLWKKRFGDGVHVINGDKPILRFRESVLRAYGTPWCGKEGWETNASVPVVAICFLERGRKNKIQPLDPKDALMRIFQQILTPNDLETVDALFPLLERTLTQTPCYVLSCNISEEAAEVAYRAMSGSKQ